MNYVTREKVLQGIAEVKEGRTFCLSLPLDHPGGSVLNPRRNPPRLAATLRDSGPQKGGQNFCYPFEVDMPGATDVVCDDVVLLTLQKFEKLADGGVQVTWNTTVEREGSDKPVLVAEWLGRHYY